MAQHIKEFLIHEYKGIRNLDLKQLNGINILTGDNNSGKTSVLELLSTLDHPQNTRSWVRGTRIVNSKIRSRRYFNAFYNMFPIDEEQKTISYTVVDAEERMNTVTLEAELEETQIAEREMHRLNGLMRTGAQKQEDDLLDTVCMYLTTYINEKEVNKDRIYDFQTILPSLRAPYRTSGFFDTIYISPVDHADGELYLNDILSDSEFYEEMLSILRIFDKNIISINALNYEDSPFSTQYMVLTKNHPKALPITAYGDGMKKAILLLSAVVQARDGILLLDEFETAIHTSAMDSIFSWVLKSAMKLNVQVFLTSHSKEAIDKVLECSEALQPYINLYTLYNVEGKNYVRSMSCRDAIEAKDNLGLELR